MIVTTIMGGLGNQLFQYAAGRALAVRTDRPLTLDATRMPAPAGEAVRELHLPALPIHPGVRILRRPGRAGRIRPPSRTALRVDHRVRRALHRWTVTDPETHDELVDLTQPARPVTLLFGYWQSHRYHVGAEELLRRELTPPVQRGSRVAGILGGLVGKDVITVHVRRGDYVEDPVVAAQLGALPVDHHRRAMALVAERCERPAFVILSDDPQWAATELRPDAPVVHAEVDAPLDALDALALMSRAQHAVIANSSLSWWGARLAEHVGQIVVAPTRWYAGRATDSTHRLPSAWIRLD